MRRYNIYGDTEDLCCYVTEEIIEDRDGEWVKFDDCEKLINALKDINEFGINNPGRGFSCAKMAEDILIAIGEQ